MKKIKQEKGVTLVILVVMIIILLILASIGVTSWNQTIEYAKFNEFAAELQVMQSKVNELNQNKKVDIGTEITENQKNILEIEEIKNIIFKNKTDEEITKIKGGFRYCSREWIKQNLELDSINRDYLINVEKRYVISCTGFEYKKKIYYMSEQLSNGQYNVEYNNKNASTGSFEVNTQKEENRWKVEISNIQYDGYVSNWQVKYKLSTNDFWQTSNELTFYVTEQGYYDIKVVHGDEIEMETKKVDIFNEYASSNLILNYDAINNVSVNEHSLTTTVWKDLSPKQNDAQITGATWGENYLYFDGVDDFAKTISNVDYEESCVITLQFVIKERLYSNSESIQMIVESSENWNSNNGYGIDFDEFGKNNINITVHYNDIGHNIKKTDDNILDDNINIFTIIINNNKEFNSFISIYKNGKLIKNNEVSENLVADISNKKFENHVMYIASREGKTAFSKMKLSALRIYNRELTQNEIKNNYEIDSKRFE